MDDGYISTCSRILGEVLEGEIKPWNHQLETWRALREHAGEKVVVLKAPTASGKTEAATIPYFYQATSGDWFLAPGLIYVLPNKTLLFSQLKRLRSIRERLGLKGKISVVADIGGIYPEKTFLFGDIVLTTLDAFAYGLFAKRTFLVSEDETLGKTLFPSGNIATSYLIFDEVQIYQDEAYYIPRILGKLLMFLHNAGVPIVVMTATLPKVLEETLLGDVAPNIEIIVQEKSRRGCVEVSLEPLKGGINILEAAKDRRFLGDILANHNRILLCCNTVRRAVELYRYIVSNRDVEESGYKVMLLHSKFINNTRRSREAQLERFREKLKKSMRELRLIVIATQVIESGVDFSFDCVLTELCPIDALIQRIGRCSRSEGEKGDALIFSIPNPKPYGKDVITKTRRILLDYEDRIAEALNRLEISQELLDRVYTDLPPLTDYAARRYSETLKTLSALSPNIDPLYYNPQVRLDPYITVIFIETFSGEEMICVDSMRIIEENHFNVEYHGRDLEKYPFLNIHGRAVEVEKISRDNSKICIEVRYVDRIYPGKTYILNPEAYDRDTGLRI